MTSTQAPVAATQSQSRPLLAALWMIGAVASFSAMAIAGREVSRELDTFELMLFRSVIGAVIVVGFGLATGCMAKVRTRRIGLHLTRNLFHFAGQNLWFYALAFIPLAQLFAIEFTTPIWIALLAPLLLGEAMTRWKLIAAVLGFAGIVIIAQPGLAPLNVGHLTAVLSTAGFCGSIMMTKALARTEATWTILFWLTMTQTGYGLIAVFWDGQVTLPSAQTAPWVVLIGLCGLTAHLSLTKALQLAPASIVAPMDFSRLPLIAFLGWLLYDEALGLAVIAGALLIVAANTLNLMAENRGAPTARTVEAP